MSAPVELTKGVLVNMTGGFDILGLPHLVTVHSPIASVSLVHIPSNVCACNTSAMEGNWRVSAEKNQSRYEICAVTMMKQFINLLDDWTAYNRRIGVNMLHIPNNAAIENPSEKYAHRIDIYVIHCTFQRSKMQAIKLFAVSALIQCEWLIGVEANVYILPDVGK